MPAVSPWFCCATILPSFVNVDGSEAGQQTKYDSLRDTAFQEGEGKINIPLLIYLAVEGQAHPRSELAQRGQQRAAIAQYHQCRQIVAEELGLAPDAETTALFEQIRAGGFPAKRAEASTSSATLSPHDLIGIPHNIPAMLTPLIGRERELAEIIARLQQPTVRLLTLGGIGGMGKTRLALAVGQAILDVGFSILDSTTTFVDDQLKSHIQQLHYPDGIFFVPLAPLTEPTMVASAIATALDLTLSGNDQRTALRQALRGKQMLLILDNFEHLLPSVGATPVSVTPMSAWQRKRAIACFI